MVFNMTQLFDLNSFLETLKISPLRNRQTNTANAIVKALVHTGFTLKQMRALKTEHCSIQDDQKTVIAKAPSLTGRGHHLRYLPFYTFAYLRSHCSGPFLLGQRTRRGKVRVLSIRALNATVRRVTGAFGHTMSATQLRVASAKQALLDNPEQDPEAIQHYYQLSQEQYEKIVNTLYSEFMEVS